MFVVIDVCVKVRVCGWGEFVAWDRGLGRRTFVIDALNMA